MDEKGNSRVYTGDDPFSMIRRATLYACGLTYEEMQRPFVAVANTFNEMHPGHMHLRSLAERVKGGVRAAGGIPLEFNTIALCDGLANGQEGMRYILPSRQVIADSVELALRAHRYDAVVMLGSCDKIIPALLMAAARVDLPAVLVTGGPMPPGYWPRRSMPVSVHVMEKLGQELFTGDFTPEQREEALASFYPCAGACWGMGTANTMACLSEALGMSLPGDATAPAVSAQKLRLAGQAGEQVMALLKSGLTPSKIMTEAALNNALKVNTALGGSLNTVLHLPALAGELGLDLSLDQFDMVSRKIPHLADVEPAGRYHVTDLDRAGGVPALMKVLEPLLEGSCLTATGGTVTENLAAAELFDSKVIRPLEDPVHRYGGIAVLKGNLAERGAVIKQVALEQELWRFSGPARVFNSEEEAMEGLTGGLVQPGDVIVVRYEGPRGGPGMREMAFLRSVVKLMGMGKTNYIITDGRFSGYSEGACIGYLSPEAAAGGAIALVEDGDVIEIDIESRSLELKVAEEDLARRRERLSHPRRELPGGYLELYSRFGASADEGGGVKLP